MELSAQTKADIWNKLAREWKLENLDTIYKEIDFSELEASLGKVLKGEAVGRYLLNLN
ncbi:MAG: hypothetical protein MK319_01160 [Pseudomonadales bacterium]|nr:hypothetical protein [Pseudomonadales bacterium]